jgi:hypothetical protein
MSGGGRRGEIRIRKARPVEKQAGGTHNRKARRAAKAQQRSVFEPALESLEAFVARREARLRAAREAFWSGKTDADIEAIALERSASEWQGLGGQWFLPLLLDAVPRWATRHYPTDPKERERRAHELGDVISTSQAAAAIADRDARGTEREGAIAQVFNAIAEGLAIGAYCPGGVMAAGMRWEVSATELRVTHGLFCARYPVDDPNYWDTAPCANLEAAAATHIAEAGS